MSDELVTTDTDLSAFTVDQIVERMPEIHRAKLRERIDKAVASDKKIRILCPGVFDMFHSGHAMLLEQIKKMLPNVELVAGICRDADFLINKGIMVMNEVERTLAVKSCRWVDEVCAENPWVLTVDFLEHIDC